MAVYTHIGTQEFAQFLAQNYDIGDLEKLIPIEQGIENSNYHLFTENNRFILTLFEQRVKRDDIPYFIDLMAHMVDKGLPCPKPIKDKNQQILQEINGKPAIIISFLHGKTLHTHQQHHATQVAAILGKFHDAGRDFHARRANSTHLSYWHDLLVKLDKKANDIIPNGHDFLWQQYHELQQYWSSFSEVSAYKGACHADLFADNVFFDDDGQLSGVIDFYFACDDYYLYDLAITVNAWCFDKNGLNFDDNRAMAMIKAYQQHRPISDDEKQLFNYFFKMAAYRILMTRLYDWVFTPSDALVKPHDPVVYYNILQYHLHHEFG